MLLILIKTYMLDIITVLIAILVLAVMYKKGYTKLVYNIVLDAVTDAERLLGGGTGPLKYSKAVSIISKNMPRSLRWLYTDEEIDEFISKALEELKDFLKTSGAKLNKE